MWRFPSKPDGAPTLATLPKCCPKLAWEPLTGTVCRHLPICGGKMSPASVAQCHGICKPLRRKLVLEWAVSDLVEFLLGFGLNLQLLISCCLGQEARKAVTNHSVEQFSGGHRAKVLKIAIRVAHVPLGPQPYPPVAGGGSRL